MVRALFLAALLCTLALSAVVARPAAALLPEPYVGLGVRTYGIPGRNATDATLTIEGGADVLLKDWGIGARIDFPGFDPAFSAEIRYSILKIPFLRLLAGLSGGVEKETRDWNGQVALWVGARASAGVPYVAVQLGAGYAQSDFQPYTTMTVGASF